MRNLPSRTRKRGRFTQGTASILSQTKSSARMEILQLLALVLFVGACACVPFVAAGATDTAGFSSALSLGSLSSTSRTDPILVEPLGSDSGASIPRIHDSHTTTGRRLAFVSAPRRPLPVQSVPQHLLQVLGTRGGAKVVTVDNDDASELEEEDVLEDDEEDEEEDEMEPEGKRNFDATLSASAVKATVKTQAKKEAIQKLASKKVVSEKLKKDGASLTTKKKGKSSSVVFFFHVPYILKASLNPWTAWKMTIAYWASLFNLDYLQPEASGAQGLRSALEEKARHSGNSKKKGRRTMKRGQAKTLSDLPQLNT